MNRGLVYLYTGEGEGKTTNSLGLATRAVGHGFKVVVIQFLKGKKDIGEYRIKTKLEPLYEIHQFGFESFVNLYSPPKKAKEIISEGLNFAHEKLKERPKLLILDEINLAAAFNLVSVEEVLQLADEIPEGTVLVLTGRRAPERLIERADLVTEMRYVKHPFDTGHKPQKGVEY